MKNPGIQSKNRSQAFFKWRDMMDTKKRNTIFCIVTVMLSVFWFQNAFGYQINLNKQLNLISLPEQPANTAIDQVTSSIAGKFNSIWAYVGGSWKLYNPGDPNFSDLLTMEAGRGYWIDMKESGTLSGTGTAAPSSIPLSTGWNLVGYNCGSLEISNALASIQGKYDSVWAFKEGVWKLYDPANPNFSDLTTIEPGFGYWINAKQSTTWTCPDDYTPRPTVPGETTPESSGQVTVSSTSSGVSLSDGTQISFQGMGSGSSVTLTLERASNTIDMGTSSIATSGSMRILTVDAVAYNGTDESSTFAPILTIPKEEIGSLNVNYVNILRVSIDPETGLEERYFFPVFQDQTGNLTFKDWLLPADILEGQANPVQKLDSFISNKATGRKFIKYSPITIQNEENTKVEALLVRMMPINNKEDFDYWRRRRTLDMQYSFDKAVYEKEMKKPVQNVVIFVHGHNEAEKIGFEGAYDPPWLYGYKKDVWIYMYDKFTNDFSDREGSTVFYEFIYPTWRPIYRHLNEKFARLVREALAPQLMNMMRVNLFIVAHSMGGIVSRAGLMLFTEQLKDNLQRLVTWGSPHHGSPLNTLRFAISSPWLNARSNTLPLAALRYFGEKEVFPTQGVSDYRWTAATFGQNEQLRLDEIFTWDGEFHPNSKEAIEWNMVNGTVLYNQDLRQLNINDDMGAKYAFLYGITEENLRTDQGQRVQNWSEFGVTTLNKFRKLRPIAQGASLVYLLVGNPTNQFMNADLGDSDGTSPVISMAGYQITNNALFIGPVNHEQYYDSIFGPDTADETYKAMDFSNKKYASPEIKLTSPTGGQTFKPDEEIPVAGQLIWPGDDKPGKRIKQIQVKSSSSGKSITLNGPTIKDDGNFSGEFKAGDLGNNQDVAASDLTVILQFKDDTELETKPAEGVTVTISPKEVTLNTGGTQTFTATVTGTTNTAVTWSVQEGSAGGTITSGGVYTAPNTAGTYHVVATSQADPTKSAAATVTVNQEQAGRFTSLSASATPGINTGTNCGSEGAYLSTWLKFAPLVWTGNSFTANGEWENGTGTSVVIRRTVSLSGTINADNSISLTGTCTTRTTYISHYPSGSVKYTDITESTSEMTIDNLPRGYLSEFSWDVSGEAAAKPYLTAVSATITVTRQYPDGTLEVKKSCTMTEVDWSHGGYVQVVGSN